MEKDYKDNKNWKYIFYDLINDKAINGEVIDGNSDYVIDYKIYIDRFNNKKLFKYFEGSYRNNDKYIRKEYDENDNIRFEGEFKEGKYYYPKENDCNKYLFQKKLCLKYEGEFKNGKYYKGKEYFNINDERIKFEGIYKEGEKYIGWEYNLYSNLIFVGKYIGMDFSMILKIDLNSLNKKNAALSEMEMEKILNYIMTLEICNLKVISLMEKENIWKVNKEYK